MHILLLTTEIAPLVSVGGIAQYMQGLIQALLQKGHQVSLALPAYSFLKPEHCECLHPRLQIPLGPGFSDACPVYRKDLEFQEDLPSVPVYILSQDRHLQSCASPSDIYAWPGPEPWIKFCRAVQQLLQQKIVSPDLVHCQDAHTAMLPFFCRHLPLGETDQAYPILLTVHNLLFQAAAQPGILDYSGIPREMFHPELLEFFGRANCLKAGLLSTDAVNTVSPTYAREISESEEYGFGLAGVFRKLGSLGRLQGILNGVNKDYWLQSAGLKIKAWNAPEMLQAKKDCRAEYFPEFAWQQDPRPVLGFRGRLDNQKGMGLIAECLPEILQKARLILVTWGDPGASPELGRIWEMLQERAAQDRDSLLVNPKGLREPGESAVHYLLSDFMLLPSRYEPCGLVQMECQALGAQPIVRQTGGLADTVFETRAQYRPSPNGFVFRDYSASSLLAAIQRALDSFADHERHLQHMQNCLEQENDWLDRIPDYEDLYSRAMQNQQQL
ncbi:MAG: glycogen synthase [Thermodesulfobacteriota bacterium]